MKNINPAWGDPQKTTGRINRKKFIIDSILFVIYSALILAGGTVLSFLMGGLGHSILASYLFVFFILMCVFYLYYKYMMTCVKRWHDMNITGYMGIVSFLFSFGHFLTFMTILCPPLFLVIFLITKFELIPIIFQYSHYTVLFYLLLFLIQACIKGTTGDNKYGKDPLEQITTTQK